MRGKFVSPELLEQHLIKLFPLSEPEFEKEDEDIGYESPPTYHRVWMSLSPVAWKCLSGASERTLRRFVDLINREVAEGGDRENAVSTCFLEHASQIGMKMLIKGPFSKTAKSELR